MPELQMFIPITKVDAAKRLVYGIATAEAEDASGEVCDYATTKPYYEKWSGNIAKTTDGKSLGNLRAMHGHVAAGKVTQIEFNDAAKQIEICAKVVDDAEWNKVVEGVYTGFSQGGAYIKRWKDETTGLQRYTAQPSEVSLVDLPCLPSATFSMIKADGAVELRKFHIKEAQPAMPTNPEIAARAADLAKAAGSDKWGEFVEAARVELVAETDPGYEKAAAAAKEAEAAELAKAAEIEAAKVAEEEAAKAAELAKAAEAEAAKAAGKVSVTTPSNNEHGDQVWKSNRDGSLFAKKAEMIAYNEAFDAAKIVADATASTDAALAELAAEVAKRATPVEPAKIVEGPAISDEMVKSILASVDGMSDEAFAAVSKLLPEAEVETILAKRAADKAAAEAEAAAEVEAARIALEKAEADRVANEAVAKAAADAELAKSVPEELRLARLQIEVFTKKFESQNGLLLTLLEKVKNIEEQPLPLPLQGRAGAVEKSAQEEADDREIAHKIVSDPEFAAMYHFKKAQQKPMAFGG